MHSRFKRYTVISIMLMAGAVYAQGPHVETTQAPPTEPIYEVTPGERPGYLYAPGYWRWDGKRYIWNHSHWIVDRPGYSWVPDGWEQRGSKWYYTKGYWEDPATGDEAPKEMLADTDKSDMAMQTGKSKTKKTKIIRKTGGDYSNKRLWPKVSQH